MANRFTNESLRNFIKTSQGKSYTVAGTTIFLLLAMFLFGVYPALGAILEQINVNTKRTDALALIETQRLTFRSLVAEQQSKEAVAASLMANLPDELNQADIADEIVALTEETNTVLISINFSNIETRRVVSKVFSTSKSLQAELLTISLEGTRNDLEDFLAQLEQSRRIVNLRNLALDKNSKGDETRPFQLELQGEVYYWSIEDIE